MSSVAPFRTRAFSRVVAYCRPRCPGRVGLTAPGARTDRRAGAGAVGRGEQVVTRPPTPRPHWQRVELARRLAPAALAAGCRERCHVMRPVHTRVPGRRVDLVAAAGLQLWTVGKWRLWAAAEAATGAGDECCSARCTPA